MAVIAKNLMMGSFDRNYPVAAPGDRAAIIGVQKWRPTETRRTGRKCPSGAG